MAVTYGFYNSLNKDRMYNAEQMSSIFNGIITDGVFSTIGDALMTVAGTGMQVIVKPGRAWFNSTWTLNDAQLPLDVPAADVSLTRIDAVILEVNSAVATRANSIKVLKGTPSANPAKPALSATETLHQYALAYITVGAGVTSITAANIEINVGKTTCPFITSVLQQTDITDLFNQWNAEFTTWFENVQAQLSGNVAANLQRQIDLINANVILNSDIATSKETYDGNAGNKLVPAAALYNTVDKIGDIRFTTRSSMGDAYLKTDGAEFDTTKYPELFAYLYPSKSMLNMTGKSKYSVGVGFVATPMLQYYSTKSNGHGVTKVSNDGKHYNNITLGRDVSVRDGIYIINDGSSKRYFVEPDHYADSDSVIEIDPNTLSKISHGSVTHDYAYAIKVFFHAFGKWYYGVSSHRGSEASIHSIMLYANSLQELITSPTKHSKVISADGYAWITHSRLLSNGYIAGISNEDKRYINVYTSHNNLLNAICDTFEGMGGSVLQSLGFFVIGTTIYRIMATVSKNSATVKIYVYNGTSSSGDATQLTVPNQGSSLCMCTYANDTAIYVLNANKELYKIVGTTITKIGSLSGSTTNLATTMSNSTAGNFWENGVGLYVDEESQYLCYANSEGTVTGSFYNSMPTITGPSGTTAYMKAKELG